MRSLIAWAGCLIAICVAGCSDSPSPIEFNINLLDVPAQRDSTGPRLSSGPDTNLVLSWMEPGDGGATLKFARFEEDAWGNPQTVVHDTSMFVNWIDLPSVLPVSSSHLVSHWMRRSPHESHAHDILVTQSFDGGQTWSRPITPHTDKTATEHGLVSVFPLAHDVGLLWLDGRKQSNGVTEDPTESAMTLRAAQLDRENRIHSEQLVDEMVCDCCQIDTAKSSDNYVAAYRDRSVDEIRDIAISRLVDDRWQPGRVPHADAWQISACPFDGPSISAADNNVSVAWFTAAPSAVVKQAFSGNAGNSFAAPIIVAEGKVLGRVTTTFIDTRSVAVSWLQTTETGYAVNVRRIGLDRSIGPVRTISDSAAGLSVPQMARSGNSMVFVWTEDRGHGERIASARVRLADL